MTEYTDELLRKLAAIQAHMRSDLLDELHENEADLDAIFDPYSYSPLVQELREKYLTRLYLLQGLIQQVAHHRPARQKSSMRVVSVAADSQEELVEQVNRKLTRLSGAKVHDVKFMSGGEKEPWSALITFEAPRAGPRPDETAALM